MTQFSDADAGVTAFLLTQVGSLAAMRFGERMAELGLTPAQAGLIRAVGMSPGRSQQALAGQLNLLPSRLVTMVDELERDGLLERRRNKSDRRLYALHLTSAGTRRLRDIARAARSHGEDFLAPLGDGDQPRLHELLNELAVHHGLAFGVHPGYRTLDKPDPDAAIG